jgi:hypothetical protein
MGQNHCFDIRNIPTILPDIGEDITEAVFCARVYQGYFFPENDDAVYKPINFYSGLDIFENPISVDESFP